MILDGTNFSDDVHIHEIVDEICGEGVSFNDLKKCRELKKDVIHQFFTNCKKH